jgi:hypothetical protein
MEEEIICNRWKDLADGPKGRESGPSVMVFLSSGTNYFSLPILSHERSQLLGASE